MTDELIFTVKTEAMFGNIDLGSMTDDELYSLIAEEYDIPRDCIEHMQVRTDE